MTGSSKSRTHRKRKRPVSPIKRQRAANPLSLKKGGGSLFAWGSSFPMADNEFHAIPRLSASGMYRVFACTASFTREWEAYDLRSRYGVPPPQPPEEAFTGIQRHRLLSAIPFSSKKLGLGRLSNLHDALKAEAGNLGIRFESAPD